MEKAYACYDKLWQLLKDRKMLKTELKDIAGIGWSTVTKLGNNANVEMDALVKICCALDCDISDIVTIVRNDGCLEDDGDRSNVTVSKKEETALTRKEVFAVMKKEYPQNLLYMINDQLNDRKTSIDVESFTQDQYEGLEYALSLLDKRSQQILELKFRKGMSSKDIIPVVGVKSVSSLANHAIYRLSLPPQLGYIVYGKNGFARKLATYETDADASLLDASVDSDEFPTRMKFALERIGITKIKEALFLTEETALQIGNLRPVDISDVSEELRRLDISHPLWCLSEKKERRP